MKNFVFRNYTIEYLFGSDHAFSGYGDINVPVDEYGAYILFYQLNPSATPEQKLTEIDEIRSKIGFVMNQLPAGKRVILFTLANEYNHDWDLKARDLQSAVTEFNIAYLGDLVQQNPSVKRIDINSFLGTVNNIAFVDWKFFFISQMVINPKLAKEFKKWYQVQLNAINFKRKKCIVLDCDNTLWGGVVGEDGLHGIALGHDYPGLCYRQFQSLLAMAASKGIILAVCSKNNEADIIEVWKENKNNILNADHISCHRINWSDKASNIKAIAADLNIGLDSLVFIDDNPMERELVKSFAPEVTVPDFPQHPYEMVDFFWKIYNEHFPAYEFSEEDLKKTRQYKENLERSNAKSTFGNIEDYLSSLDIEIDIYPASESNIARIAQMTQKTNQFNLTTKRYTEEDIRALANDENAFVFCSGVKDKFGDNGITIAGIIKKTGENAAEIDSYLLSCRILGRNIETVALQKVLNSLFSQSISNFTAKFAPTAKNALAANFLDTVGFVVDRIDENSIKHYSLKMNDTFILKNYYKINYHEK